jgi:hypothetical protein
MVEITYTAGGQLRLYLKKEILAFFCGDPLPSRNDINLPPASSPEIIIGKQSPDS